MGISDMLMTMITLMTCFRAFESSRGNSKYHYYGIRVKPDSPLNRLQEDTQYMAMRQQPVHQKQRSPFLALYLPLFHPSLSPKSSSFNNVRFIFFSVNVSHFRPVFPSSLSSEARDVYRSLFVDMSFSLLPVVECNAEAIDCDVRFIFADLFHIQPLSCLCRFKPLQKVDGMPDNLCVNSHCNNTPEQSVAAQSQHHQQYIGQCIRRCEPYFIWHLQTHVHFHSISCLSPVFNQRV